MSAPSKPLRVADRAAMVPVPPTVYGGTEIVVDQLARAYQAGCDVLLFATGDSTCPVERRWLYPGALVPSPTCPWAAHVPAPIGVADVDVIHDHTLTGPRGC